MTITYQSALGINTGDTVTTSYNTGPYTVTAISAPYNVVNYVSAKVILPWPAISLTLAYTLATQAQPAYINEVHQEGDNYFSGRDQIFVAKQNAAPQQFSLFASETPLPPPYPFQPGVNYNCLDYELWQCQQCHKDFNALTVPTYDQMIPGDPRGYPPRCPACSAFSHPLYIIQPHEQVSSYWLQSNGRLVEQYRLHHPERIAYLTT